eukprot:COSAG04_NODE_3338_length_2915_cov_1.732599_3_plen_56_part_00
MHVRSGVTDVGGTSWKRLFDPFSIVAARAAGEGRGPPSLGTLTGPLLESEMEPSE